jgi:hypothetical protein
MKHKSLRGMPVALLTLALSPVAGWQEPATAMNNPTTTNTLDTSQPTSFQVQDTFQLAQSLVGQCRVPTRRIFIYSERSTSSPTVRTIGPNDSVTLADDGAGGWIAISSPTAGYVRANDLTTCQAATPPQPTPSPSKPPVQPPSTTTTSLCRLVTYNGPEGGLAIRTQPDRNARRVDGVRFGERVTLRTSPPTNTVDKDGRNWVEVTAPSRGWLSNGYSKSPNLGLCP